MNIPPSKSWIQMKEILDSLEQKHQISLNMNVDDVDCYPGDYNKAQCDHRIPSITHGPPKQVYVTMIGGTEKISKLQMI